MRKINGKNSRTNCRNMSSTQKCVFKKPYSLLSNFKTKFHKQNPYKIAEITAQSINLEFNRNNSNQDKGKSLQSVITDQLILSS
jgi:hypothetical protein